MEYEEITREIIRIFFKVYNILGDGFLERVYVGAMKVELDRAELRCVRELPIKVNYEGVIVGEYFCDLLVEEKVLVEVKAVSCLSDKDERQLRNYLKATRVEVGLLMNFGDEAKFKRQYCSNESKGV
ncbi:MAG: GxxExxY protein [Nanoarchaeota archaeon]|nr:GxxExxY protein [Nanoarchaeota archaeon]